MGSSQQSFAVYLPSSFILVTWAAESITRALWCSNTGAVGVFGVHVCLAEYYISLSPGLASALFLAVYILSSLAISHAN